MTTSWGSVRKRSTNATMSPFRSRNRNARSIASASPRRMPSVTTAAASSSVTRNPDRSAGRYLAITSALKKVSASRPIGRTASRPDRGLRVEDALEKLARPLVGGVAEDGGRRPLLDDLAAVHEQHAVA